MIQFYFCFVIFTAIVLASSSLINILSIIRFKFLREHITISFFKYFLYEKLTNFD